ncbi:MAG: RNA polymerase sigma-70 factor [Bacteroidia bacterium]|nr:RNA polymerase sigma-70 factor [Bacteroidia bacterium]
MANTLDITTFERLFKEEFKGLVVFAIQYVKDYEAAREIVQEAFIGLWDKRGKIDPSRQVKSYLSTTVRNRSLNYLRDNKKFDTRVLTRENLYPLASYEQADRLVEKELKENIQEAISELPEKCREVFLLSRNEHLKYQAIADQLQISVKTVETQMSKALQHLRIRLKEYLIVILLFICLPIPLPRHFVPRNDNDTGCRCFATSLPRYFTTLPSHNSPVSLPRYFAISLPSQGNQPLKCIMNG